MTTSIKITNEGPGEVTLDRLSQPSAAYPDPKVLNSVVIPEGDFRTTVVASDISVRITHGVRPTDVGDPNPPSVA